MPVSRSGAAVINGADHASLWNGTAASWVDLDAFLPSHFSSSVARGIWSDETTLYISGWGHNTLTRQDEAVLWTQPIPAPSAVGVMGVCGMLAFRRRRS